MSSHPQTDSVLPPVQDAPLPAPLPDLASSSADLSDILERFRSGGEIDFNKLVISAQRAGVAAGVLTLPVVETPPQVIGVPSAAPEVPVVAPVATPAPAPAPQPVSPLMGFEANTPEQMRTLRDAGLLPPGIWERYVEIMRAQRAAPQARTAPVNGHGAAEAPTNGRAAPATPEDQAMQMIQRLNRVGVALASVALPLLEADVALGITLAPDGWIVGSAILEDTEVNGEVTRLQHPILGYDGVEFNQLGDVVGRVLRETVHRLRQEQGRG